MNFFGKFAGRVGQWPLILLGTVLLTGISIPVFSSVIIVDTLVDELNVDDCCSLRGPLQDINGGNHSGSTNCADGQLAGGNTVLNGTELPTIIRALNLTGPVPGNQSGISLDGDQSLHVTRIQATFDTQVIQTVYRSADIAAGQANDCFAPGSENLAVPTQNVGLIHTRPTWSGIDQNGVVRILEALF